MFCCCWKFWLSCVWNGFVNCFCWKLFFGCCLKLLKFDWWCCWGGYCCFWFSGVMIGGIVVCIMWEFLFIELRFFEYVIIYWLGFFVDKVFCCVNRVLGVVGEIGDIVEDYGKVFLIFWLLCMLFVIWFFWKKELFFKIGYCDVCFWWNK